MALLDHFTANEIADALRELGWSVTPPATPPADPPDLPAWLVEDPHGEGFNMIGGGRDD